MRRITIGLALVAAACASMNPSQADDFYPYSLMLHVTPPSYSGCGEPTMADAVLNCGMVDPEGKDFGPFTPIFVWVVVGGVPPCEGNAGGIGGIRFGIQYEPTVLVAGWAVCAGSEVQGPGWPGSGTGDAITWQGGCYCVTANTDGMTKVGFFQINPTSAGGMVIVEDPQVGFAQAADCAPVGFRICRQLMGKCVLSPNDGPCDLYDHAAHGIGSAAQEVCNPCGGKCAVPMRSTSWGSIKTLYR